MTRTALAAAVFSVTLFMMAAHGVHLALTTPLVVKPAAANPAAASPSATTAPSMKEIRPGDDFFNYANGDWLAKTEIPADRSSWGTFAMMAEDTNSRIVKMIEALAKDKQAGTSLVFSTGRARAGLVNNVSQLSAAAPSSSRAFFRLAIPPMTCP